MLILQVLIVNHFYIYMHGLRDTILVFESVIRRSGYPHSYIAVVSYQYP